MLENLNIARDCWWAMPSGDIYTTDENGNLPSHSHALYTGLNPSESTYVEIHGGSGSYIGRLESSNLDVNAVTIGTKLFSGGNNINTELLINGISIGDFGDYDYAGTEYGSGTFNLTSAQKERLLLGRTMANYDYFELKVGNSGVPVESGVRLYNIEIEYSGDYTWDNHKVGLPNVITNAFVPTSMKSFGGSVWDGSITDINQYIVESGVDNNYITHNNIDSYGTYWTGSKTMPSGGLVLSFNDLTSSVNVDTFYDEQNLYPGSGVGLTQSNLINATPSGMSGYAVWTSGEAGHVSCGDIYSLGLNDASVMCWIKTDESIGASFAAVGKTKSGINDHRYYVGLAAGGYPRVYFEYDGGGTHTINGATTINDGDWHHIAFVLDRDDRIELFCDGESCGSDSASTYVSRNNQVNHDFKIGWGQDYINQGNIYIDDARIYLQPLSSGDIQAIASGVLIDKTPNSQWTFDRQVTQGLDPLTQITRARLNLRMALPPSGEYENAFDTFEINGYNHLYKNQDHKEDLSYIDTSQTPLHRRYGYYTYGAGDIIKNKEFSNYITELNFLDPAQPSGLISSTRHANADMLQNTEFQIIGLPSGVQISAAELQVEYIPNNHLGLYIIGDAYRCAASSTIDAGTSTSYRFGDGGWHHRGWRLRGPTVIEEDVFDNFYTFSESSGTRTYPETTKAYYFPTGDEDQTVYADYVLFCPEGTEGDQGDVTPYLKNPQRREYYRNPISAEDLTPAWYSSTVDITNIKPSYYRHMIYHGDSMDFLDLDNIDDGELAQEDLCQIYFEDRLNLEENFTLFFMIYRDYGFQSYGRFFHRGLTEEEGIHKYEVYGDLNPDNVRFTVQAANGQDYDVEVPLRGQHKEPLLIWFSCGYGIDFDEATTLSLSVHDNAQNYFGEGWTTVKSYFSYHRKRYSSNEIEVTPPGRGGITVEYGGPRTVIGSLESITFSQNLLRNLYLHRASICEFGYANEYIELDYDTTDYNVKVGYDTSQDKDKHFLATRVCNSQYLQNNPSGVNWVVPYGSGGAQWSTSYELNEWRENNTAHSLINPVSTAGTNLKVAPSSILVDLEAAHSTDHPSGVQVWVDIEFDSGASDNFKVSHHEFTIPSGGATKLQYDPIVYRESVTKHINMDEGPILYSNIDNINVTVTTKYHDIGTTEYEGNLTIHSLNVYFDSVCVAATGLNGIDLYIYGDPTTFPINPNDASTDLYIQGKTVIQPSDPSDGTSNLDLYIAGYPHLASGDLSDTSTYVTLFIDSDNYQSPPPDDPDATWLNLFVEGLDPPMSSGDMPLYLWATASGVGGMFDTFPLYINSNLDPRNMLPLYVKSGPVSDNTSMNLYLYNNPWTYINDSGIPLTIVGPDGIKASGAVPPEGSVTNLYIRGYGETDGYYWNSGRMNLYIDRESEATASRLSLFMAQNETVESLNNFIHGHIAESTINRFFVISDGNNNYYSLIDIISNVKSEQSSIIQPSDPPTTLPGKSVLVDYNESYQIPTGSFEPVLRRDRSVLFWHKSSIISSSSRTIFKNQFSDEGSFVVTWDYSLGYVIAKCIVDVIGKTPTTVDASGLLSLVNDKEFHHYACVVDRASNFEFYIDGNLQDSTAINGYAFNNWGPEYSDNERFQLGIASSELSYYYDIRNYYQVVDQNEISNIINRNIETYTPSNHWLANRVDSPSLFIKGSGSPPNNHIDLFTSGY